MTAKQELYSWVFPGSVDTTGKSIPDVNGKAPSSSEIPFPRTDGRPVVIVFLRHCGCPFAEQVFRQLRNIASANPDVECIAVSHSNQDATDKWTRDVGGAGDVKVIVDFERRLYGAYGLGISSFYHVLNPWSMRKAFSLGRTDKIPIRPTESGTRWQTGGLFAVDSQGTVRYSHPARTTDDIGDVEAAVKSVGENAKL